MPPSAVILSTGRPNNLHTSEAKLHEEKSEAYFDHLEFLLLCCCDSSFEESLQKVFLVLSDEEGRCTFAQVHSIFTRFLHITKSTHRFDNLESIYSAPSLIKVFEAVGMPNRITWKEFVKGCSESQQRDWLSCPLYPLEDLTLASSSRPSSGKANAPPSSNTL